MAPILVGRSDADPGNVIFSHFLSYEDLKDPAGMLEKFHK